MRAPPQVGKEEEEEETYWHRGSRGGGRERDKKDREKEVGGVGRRVEREPIDDGISQIPYPEGSESGRLLSFECWGIREDSLFSKRKLCRCFFCTSCCPRRKKYFWPFSMPRFFCPRLPSHTFKKSPLLSPPSRINFPGISSTFFSCLLSPPPSSLLRSSHFCAAKIAFEVKKGMGRRRGEGGGRKI